MRIVEGSVEIREFCIDDIPQKVKWINDPNNNEFLHYDLPLEIDKTIRWFNNKDNSKRFDGVIEYNGTPVGLIGLLAIDNNNKKAEYYISMGNPAYKKRGIATIATRLILKYAFETLNLHKVYLNVDDLNIAACKLYEKSGFKCEGYFYEDLLVGKSYINRKRYAIINKQ